jgi:DNA-binding response OmpR family regulator
MSTGARPVLAIEDADADFAALARAFAAADPDQTLLRDRTCEAALLRLEKARASPGAMPSLVLVDLNLPLRNGLSFVEQLKRDAGLRALPIVVLTSSTNPRDIIDSYAAGANGYIAKPFELTRLVTTIGLVHRYWREAVIVPPLEAFVVADSRRHSP